MDRLCPDFLSAGFDLCGILEVCAPDDPFASFIGLAFLTLVRVTVLVPALRICGRCRRLVVAAFAAGLAIEGGPQFIGKSRSSHCVARFLMCLKFRIAGSPSRTIVAPLRSLADNIIALATAERSFIVP